MTDFFKPLKLLANDEDGLQLISTYLQDSLFPIMSFTYDQETKIFNCLINRFCWEHVDDHPKHGTYHRVHSGLCFATVIGVHKRGFHQASPHRMHTVLMISCHKTKHGTINIHILFSGNKELRLEAESLQCTVTDDRHPWPTHKKPMHLHEHLQELHQGRS
ncbi:MAG: DUF2948 family protein [Alphaproteobacteria bacterium]|nr:DUF2948 family protein [Alphaproteobacteria bacterium]